MLNQVEMNVKYNLGRKHRSSTYPNNLADLGQSRPEAANSMLVGENIDQGHLQKQN